jgi:hypothetical protein
MGTRPHNPACAACSRTTFLFQFPLNLHRHSASQTHANGCQIWDFSIKKKLNCSHRQNQSGCREFSINTKVEVKKFFDRILRATSVFTFGLQRRVYIAKYSWDFETLWTDLDRTVKQNYSQSFADKKKIETSAMRRAKSISQYKIIIPRLMP